MAALVAAAAGLVACGEQQFGPSASSPYRQGAELFREHCSGCHTLAAAEAEGSATKVRDRERNDGPNFNVRREQVNQVLYAIRNGGFSGAIMPQNIVTGNDAEQIAHFLAKYSGAQASTPPAPTATPGQAGSGGSASPGQRRQGAQGNPSLPAPGAKGKSTK